MKKVILSATCFAFIGLGFISCEKEQLNHKKEVEIKNQTSNSLEKSGNIQNDFVNPYEFVGEIHNKALHEVRTMPNFDLLKNDEVFSLINQIVKTELDLRGIQFTNNPAELTQEMIDETENNTPNELWEKLLFDLDKDSKQIMMKFDDDVNSYLLHGDLGLAIQKMKNRENQVSNDPKFNTEEKIFILSMLSLARNTFIYWNNEDVLTGGAFLSKGKIKADIKGFKEGWNDPVSDNGTFGDRWRAAINSASYYSQQE